LILSILLTVPPATVIGRQVFATDSLKDQARANGGKIVAQSQTTMPIGSLATVASGAEVIVQGKILTVEPRLTKDERFVRSYCSILPHRILKDTVGTGSAARPGNTEPLVFAEPGGTVRVDGLEISYRSNLASEPPLEAGEEIIAFLVRAPEWGAFRLHYGPFGLLRLRGDRVVAANQDVERSRPLASNSVSDIQLQLLSLLKSNSGRE
jgi:hypothetical protein